MRRSTPLIFEPFQLKSLVLKNRVVMLPLVVHYATVQGQVTDQLIKFYEERAAGSPGLIIVEAATVAVGGKATSNQLVIYSDDYVPGLRRLAHAIKRAGVPCILQIEHGGRMSRAAVNEGCQPIAPSVIKAWNCDEPRSLTTQEIEQLVEDFGRAACRAQEAGFDGVEVHLDHGYLPAQFFSPLTNKRTDKYGGSLEARARFGVQLIDAVSRKVGEDFIISARFCGDEFVKGGITARDAQVYARMLERSGVSVFNVSGGYRPNSEEGYINAGITHSLLPMGMPRGHFVPAAASIKKAVKAPVIACGRLDDFNLAEQVLAERKADLVGIGRGFLADPLLVKKYSEGNVSDIRRCIACNTCQITLRSRAEGVSCAVNADLGKKGSSRNRRVKAPRKVLVVGGGPAGLETAKVAGALGHNVTIVEQRGCLGGNLKAASALWFRKDISHLVDYLSAQVYKQDTKILLNTRADPGLIKALTPEVVVLATGAIIQSPAIPGIEASRVADVLQVLNGQADTGSRVIVLGGGSSACEVASFLSEQKKRVTLVTRGTSDFTLTSGLAADMEPALRKWFLFEYWPKLSIEVVAKSRVSQITGSGLMVIGDDGEPRVVPGDTIVFSETLVPNRLLSAQVKTWAPEVYEIGDCVGPRKLIDAIHEGNRVAHAI